MRVSQINGCALCLDRHFAALNALPHRRPSDREFAQVRMHFDDAQVAQMSFAAGGIRAWNMFDASFRRPLPQARYAVAQPD